MSLRQVIVAVCVLGMASLAGAAVTPIGEFSGTMSEGFENIFSPGGYPGPIPIFNANATMDDTLAHFVVIAFVWSGPAGQVLPYDGNLFSGTVAGSTKFQFSTPVTEFGGFMTTVGLTPGGTVNFFDPQGGLIDSLSAQITPLEWGWQGWSSSSPIGSIELIGANVPGISTLYDDLQVTFVPEPAALALVAVGGLLLGRKR